MKLVGVREDDLEDKGIGEDDLLWGPLKGKAKRRIHGYRLIAGCCASDRQILLSTAGHNVNFPIEELIKAYI